MTSRWSIAGLHLAASMLVILALGAFLVKILYPYGLFHLARADRLLILIGAINAAAGPLLTLIVFKQGKPGLKLDLTVIGFAQIALLSYGLSVVWQSRPVFLVALPERVVLVFANEIEADALPSTGEMPRERLPWFGPELVGTRMPEDPTARHALYAQLAAGRDLPQFPQFYVPFEEVAFELLAASDPVNAIGPHVPASIGIEARQALSPRFADTGRIVPITSSRGIALMVIDKHSAHPLEAWTSASLSSKQ